MVKIVKVRIPKFSNFLSSMYSQFTYTAHLDRGFKRGMKRLPCPLPIEEEAEDENPAMSAQLFQMMDRVGSQVVFQA